MTLRLGYLPWLWEHDVKSLLCFIWSQLNLSSVIWCKSTSPGNVLIHGLTAILFPIRFRPSFSSWEGGFLPSKHFVETDVFPTKKKFNLRNQHFLYQKKEVLLENSWLTPALSTDEVNWPLASSQRLCLFISKQLQSCSSGQEIAKKPRLHLNSAFNCNLHWVQFWNNLYIEDVVSTTYWTHWTSHVANLPALQKT